jgi:iron complex outermembrane recepter protein
MRPSSFKSVLLISSSLLALPAFAQSPAPVADTAPAEEIIVTGTRATNRTVADSNVPIDVISSETLTRQGSTEVNRMLNTLVPSFNFPQPSITDGTDVIRPATLRGLGPDQTLVLVNGKRRHVSALLNVNNSIGRGSAAVDMNLIPSIAIGRIEVLRDGAASQYGSDAIAGVINVQLKKANEGGSFSATIGGYNGQVDGVKQLIDLQRTATGGLAADPNDPVVPPNSPRVFQGSFLNEDRKVSDGFTVTLAGNIGVALGAEGFVNLSAEYRDRNPTNRAGYDMRNQYQSAIATSPADPRELTFNRLSHRFGDAKTEDWNLFLNAGLPITEGIELYGWASYGKRDGESAGFYRRANDNRNLTSIYPDGFLPLIVTDLKDASVTAGLKADVAGWNVDLSYSYGRNRFDFSVQNSLNRALAGIGNRQTSFDAGGLRFKQNLVNLDVQRDIEFASFKSVSLAFGGEYRSENFAIRAGEPNSYIGDPANPGLAAGAQVFPGFRPSNAGANGRNSKAAYAEIDADISDTLNISAAGRFEDFSDFGSTWNGKVAGRFEPIDGLALRGAISNGFRAPSLHQQFFAATATNNLPGVGLVEVSTLPVNDPVAKALGAKPLKAEKSTNYSVGFVFNMIDRLNITVDFYQIKIRDRIVLTENLGASPANLTLPGAVPNNDNFIRNYLVSLGLPASAGRYFINGIDTRTRGVEVVATYRFDLADYGNLALTAGYNYNEIKVTAQRDQPGALLSVPGLNASAIDLFSTTELLRFEKGQPKDKLNLSAVYDWNWLGVTLATTRYGSVISAGSAANRFLDNVELKAKWVTNTEVRIKPFEQLQLAVGVDNLFDVYPTKLPVGQIPGAAAGSLYSVNNYFLPYSSFSPFGFNGRYLYARATVSW